MPAINFQRRFTEQVASGEKRSTIRAGKRFKAGMTLYLFAGLRTTNCVRLKTVVCIYTCNISIRRYKIVIDGKKLSGAAAEALSNADGFPSTAALCKYLSSLYGEDFRGQIIKW